MYYSQKKADIFMNYLNISEENILRNYYNNISHYFTFIDYHSEKSFYIDNITRFIQQYNLIKDYLNRIFHDISLSMGCDNPLTAIELFEKMMSEMEMLNPIASNRVMELDVLSSSVNPIRLKNNPIELDKHTIWTIYDTIIK